MIKKLFFAFLFIPFLIVLMNMVYPAISYIKGELYKSTRYHILNHRTGASETVSFYEKELINAEWKEENEFVLNGFSYDIIKIDLKNGKKHYHCYFDKKEIVINSILKFSGFFVTKKVDAWRHFNIPVQHKKIIKTSGFYIFSDSGQPDLFTFCFKPESGYLNQLEITNDLSVIIPPPEESFIS